MDKRTQEFLDFVFDKKKVEKMARKTYKKNGLQGTATNAKKVKAEAIWRSGFSYGELEFYRFKSSRKINIAKMSRCMGLSENFIRLKLAQRGLL